MEKLKEFKTTNLRKIIPTLKILISVERERNKYICLFSYYVLFSTLILTQISLLKIVSYVMDVVKIVIHDFNHLIKNKMDLFIEKHTMFYS